MEKIILAIENIVWSVPLVCLLMGTHIYFTLKLKFPQKYTLKGLKNILFSDKKNTSEGISSFKSVMAVLAATLGIGNIIGVATAILIGGIGSVFWIFISGVFAIATKYAETYIVLKYRKKDKTGSYGGTMYVLRDRVGSPFLGMLFCLFLLLTSCGMGAMIQSNAISSTLMQNFEINKYLVALIITVICGYILFGNEKRISDISSIFIPIATVVYLVSCCALLYLFRANIMSSIYAIIQQAFDFRAAAGGIFASVAIRAMNTGLSKGLFTNEAGIGTSPIFDATVKEKDIKKQAIMSSTTVFIDTVVLCTITGIVFVASGMYHFTSNPVEFAQNVFLLLPGGKYIFIFVIVIFAISTIPCSGFYGTMAIKYLFKSRSFYQIVYKLIFITFIFIGSLATIKLVWSLSSIANALMAIPNLMMLYYLKEEIK